MKLTQVIASATVAAVLGTAGVSVASASSSSSAAPRTVNPTSADPTSAAPKGRRARRFVRQAVALAARTIGVQPGDLVAELRTGKTIADVANEHGVSPQTVIDALVKAATDKIEAAKTAGKITDARATKLEQRLPTVAGRLVNEWHPRAGGAKAGKAGRASVTAA